MITDDDLGQTGVIGAVGGTPSVVPKDGPPKPPVVVESASEEEGQEKAGFVATVLAGWKGLVVTLGAIAGTVAGYAIIQKLGEGKVNFWWMLAAVLALVVFALGVAAVLAVPILLTANSRTSLSEAVAREAVTALPSNWQKWTGQYVKYPVGTDILLGHKSITAFNARLTTLLAEAQRYWDNQPAAKVPAGLRQQLEAYIAQREEIQKHIAAGQVAATSRKAIAFAVGGIVAVTFGFSVATIITNQGIRDGKIDDEARKFAEETAGQLIDFAVTEAGEEPAGGVGLITEPTAVLLSVPEDGTVEDRTAEEVLGLDDDVVAAATCYTDRAGIAYAVSGPLEDGDDPLRVVLVALGATADCAPADVRVEPGWVRPAGAAGGGGATTETETQTDGGGDTAGTPDVDEGATTETTVAGG